MTRKELILLTLITLFGAALRWIHLSALSIWMDEGYTAWAINHSPGEIIRLIRADTAPPLYYLLLHFWTHFFGRGEAGLRSLSALAGTVQIPLVYLIARKLLKRTAASTAEGVTQNRRPALRWSRAGRPASKYPHP
ncbi:MAG TPA: glycosyltransferase family 39 protein, partial [Tepidisphaeraceae bacterium]|nr:glycosyltransferase family 39 protein [Tepidisphaeraceae bacterium]